MDTATLMGLAQGAVDNGNLNAACEMYEVALQGAPNNSDILEAYAEIMMHYVQDAKRAEQMLRHAIVVAPDEGYIKYLNLAQLLQGQASLECYRTAFNIMGDALYKCRKEAAIDELKREQAQCLTAIAELYLTDLCDDEHAEGNCEKALDEAAKCYSGSVEVYQAHASLRLSQERNEEALIDLHKAVELTHSLGEEYQPTYESKVELGKLLMQVCPDEAFRFLLEILSLNDSNPYVWFLLGETSRMRKRYPDSARLLKHARSLISIIQAGDEALIEVDQAIRQLLEEMGGEEALNNVTDLDKPNPLDYLSPEDDEMDEGGEELEAEPCWENTK